MQYDEEIRDVFKFQNKDLVNGEKVEWHIVHTSKQYSHVLTYLICQLLLCNTNRLITKVFGVHNAKCLMGSLLQKVQFGPTVLEEKSKVYTTLSHH